MNKRLLISTLILLFVLNACRPTPTTEPTVAVKTESTQSVPYPGPGVPAQSSGTPYPMPPTETLPVENIILMIPTPGAGTGVVIGQLLNNKTKEPLKFQSIYLAVKIYLTPGPSYSIGVQEKSSPHTMSDKEGRFAIGNVPPGSYLVMVWTPWQASVVIDPNTNTDLEITVRAGQTVDIGQLEAADPFTKP